MPSKPSLQACSNIAGPILPAMCGLELDAVETCQAVAVVPDLMEPVHKLWYSQRPKQELGSMKKILEDAKRLHDQSVLRLAGLRSGKVMPAEGYTKEEVIAALKQDIAQTRKILERYGRKDDAPKVLTTKSAKPK
jgi:hypothetical protein